MKKPFHVVLSFKFAILVIVAGFVVFGLYLAWSFQAQRTAMEGQVLAEARVLNLEMSAAWDYITSIQDQINYTNGEYDFKNVYCSVAGKSIALRFTRDSDYVIRYARENPRSGTDEPDTFESRALQAFQANKANEYYETTEFNGKPAFRYASSLLVENDCLRCHGDPVGEYDLTVLLADDDPSLREAIGIMVRGAGYTFFEAADGPTALALFEAIIPDLVVLDVMMGDMSGFEVCESIRQKGFETPVLFLSAKGEIGDKKDGFRAGADDYLVKPFNEEELLLRVEALMKRAHRTSPIRETEASKLTVEDLVVDLLRHEVLLAGKRIELTPKEFGILAAMAKHPGEVFSRDDLVRAV